MSKCSRCNVNILDDSVVCPLCNGVLQLDNDISSLADKSDVTDLEVYPSKSVMYPDTAPITKRAKFAIKIIVFLSVVIEVILMIINYCTYKGVKWSLICGAALVYMCFTLLYSFRRTKSHRTKMLALAIGAMVMVYAIDLALGYMAWSVNYAVPIIIMFMDVNIIVLMMVNYHEWQNYILIQFGMLVISVAFGLLIFANIVTKPVLTIIAVGVSALLLASTLVFGDKKAITELGRRFRV